MDYGQLTITNQNLLVDKAKLKLDGVYSFRGIEYRVRRNGITHFACGGEILAAFGNFNVIVGKYSGYSDVAKKVFKAIKD
jgi:hypothetical protein